MITSARITHKSGETLLCGRFSAPVASPSPPSPRLAAVPRRGPRLTPRRTRKSSVDQSTNLRPSKLQAILWLLEFPIVHHARASSRRQGPRSLPAASAVATPPPPPPPPSAAHIPPPIRPRRARRRRRRLRQARPTTPGAPAACRPGCGRASSRTTPRRRQSVQPVQPGSGAMLWSGLGRILAHRLTGHRVAQTARAPQQNSTQCSPVWTLPLKNFIS